MNIECEPTINITGMRVDMGGGSSESNAEAWAVGERHGVPVDENDQTYHNNSKYWSQRAAEVIQPFIVTITKSGSTYSSDKTAAEISEAISGGRKILIKDNEDYVAGVDHYETCIASYDAPDNNFVGLVVPHYDVTYTYSISDYNNSTTVSKSQTHQLVKENGGYIAKVYVNGTWIVADEDGKVNIPKAGASTFGVVKKNDDATNDPDAVWSSQKSASANNDKFDKDNVAAEYENLTFPVKAGDYCLHNGKLWYATQDISSQEQWNADHWARNYLAADVEYKADKNVIADQYEYLHFPVSAGTYCFYRYYLYKANCDIQTRESWNDSHWDLVHVGEELSKASGTFVVTEHLDTTLNKKVLDSTFAEIKQAYEDGKVVFLKNSEDVSYYDKNTYILKDIYYYEPSSNYGVVFVDGASYLMEYTTNSMNGYPVIDYENWTSIADVTIDGNSISQNGIADIPLADATHYGVVKKDDTAGSGDTGKVWSADKSATELSRVNGAITKCDEEISTMIGSLYSETANGGEVVHIQNGADLPFSSLITDLDLVQSGSGDASLENIRPISPVTGSTAYVSETQDAQDAETYPVNWGSTVNTVASGEVDLVKGSMTETWEFVSVLWKNIRTGTVSEATGLEYGLITFPHTVENATAQSAYGAKVICNVCSTIKWNGASSTPAHFYIENSKAYIYIPHETDGEQEIQFAVKLTSPIERNISGATINGLKDCYVWTNTGNIKSISYVAQMDTFIENTNKTNNTVSNIVDYSLVLENAVPFGFATADGSDSLSATTYWNTGMVPIPGNSSILSANASIYKTAFFGADGAFISCNNTDHENISIPSNTRYVKIQISNSSISYANRTTLRITCDSTELTKVSDTVIPGVLKGKYEYEGERIVTKPLYNVFGLIASASCQAGCVYEDSLFRFKTDGTFLVYDLTTRAKIADGSGIVVSGLYPHCNTACFGDKYSSSDPYPLLYVNAYNTEGLPKGTCYVFRISVSGATMTASLVQTITIGFTEDSIWKSGDDVRPYGNFCVDLRNKALFVYTLRDTGSVTRFFRFALPATSSATVTLSQSDIVEYWDTDYYPYIQDNACAYGKIYLCSGYGGSGSNPGMIHVIDTIQRKEVSRINLYKNGMQGEPEVLDFYKGDLICGDSSIFRFVF